jgi:hypothetical protein
MSMKEKAVVKDLSAYIAEILLEKFFKNSYNLLTKF